MALQGHWIKLQDIHPSATSTHVTPKPARNTLFTASAALLLCVATVALGQHGDALGMLEPHTSALVISAALFSIVCGFSHPDHGYVSFDRVTQVASILLLGPAPAALLNGLASLLYPLHRVLRGESWRSAVDAAMANAGMMILIILAAGSAYQTAGGDTPIGALSTPAWIPLLVMMMVLHLSNELCMAWFLWLRERKPWRRIASFSYAVEGFSILIGISVAAILPQIPLPEDILLLIILATGMVVVRQLAMLRQTLSRQIAERTQELEAKTSELDRLAKVDALTGLPNRRSLENRLDALFDSPAETREGLYIAILDIDHFKQVNDQHSHALGDEVLRELGNMIRSNQFSQDSAGRYGGDEFILCLQRTQRHAARETCQALLQQFSQHRWSSTDQPVHVSASIGLTAVRAEDSRTAALARADRRLYAAKSAGRNQLRADDDAHAT